MERARCVLPDNEKTPHSFRFAASKNPAGTLANYLVSKSGISTDPSETEGQIPTINVTVADTDGKGKSLIGKQVVLRDWTSNNSTGRVANYRHSGGGSSTSYDIYSVFERLNVEKTAYPIILGEGGNALATTLAHWTLMAGVPQYRVPGNLKHYLDMLNNSDGVGYMADSLTNWRFFGPSTEYRDYVPTSGQFGTRLEVNLSQGIIIGMQVASDVTLSETKIAAAVEGTVDKYEFILRRNKTVYSLIEKNLTTGVATTLISGNYALRGTGGQSHFIMVSVAASPADPGNKVDLALRILEGFGTDPQDPGNTYGEFLATGVVSKLPKRPRTYKLSGGYDPTLTAGHSYMGQPWTTFISEGTVLPDFFPIVQVWLGDYNGTGIQLEGAGDAADKNFPSIVPGFTGNVWDQIKQFCAVYSIDVYFIGDSIVFRDMKYRRASNYSFGGPADFIPARAVTKTNLQDTVDFREPARNVEVAYTSYNPQNSYGNTELWRADSVYSIAKGEKLENVVQTESSFVFLNQPVPVGGVPVPYTSAFGSYVVTGADGYIVDPQWWKDNGGSLTVEPTGKSGEIKITIQAPQVDTTRAPYRISEGAADRPALYIFGYGLKTKEKTITVPTGNPDASRDVGVTFNCPYITNDLMAYNTALKLATKYAAADSSISFEVQKSALEVRGSASNSSDYRADYSYNGTDYEAIEDFDCVYWDGSYFRIVSTTTGPNGLSVQKAARHNTIRILNAEFATGKTVADWNNLHAGKTIGDVNLAPLPRYIS